MMKRKVSVIWVVVFALIAIAACAFAAVTYYRCEKQPEPQFPENELLRVLDAGSDAEGVGFEVMRIGGGSMNLRLDLRWKNDSGKTIAYETSFHLPWAAIGIAVLSVFLVVFATMMYAMSKVKKDNPIDALKNENL